MRSWFYLVHHSNLLCSFMKLLQIALQPKPNCCWNAFSKMENTEKYNTVIVSQPTLYIVLLNYIVLYFQVFNIVSHWGIDNTEDILWPFLSEYPNNIPHRFISQITLQPFIRSQGIKSVLRNHHMSQCTKELMQSAFLAVLFLTCITISPVQLQLQFMSLHVLERQKLDF